MGFQGSTGVKERARRLAAGFEGRGNYIPSTRDSSPPWPFIFVGPATIWLDDLRRGGRPPKQHEAALVAGA